MRDREEDKKSRENESNRPLLQTDHANYISDIKFEGRAKPLFEKNPLENSNFVSRIFFSWVTPLTWVRKNSKLTNDNLLLFDTILKQWFFYYK